MYLDSMVSASIITLVATFSLAWFVVGIFVGRLAADRATPTRNRRSRRRKDNRLKKASGKAVEIYVGNLSYDVGDKELRKVFAEHGKVGGVRIIKNRSNGKSKGYGFVDMPNRAEAMAAVKALNGSDLKGRRMVANEAKSRPRD